MASSPEPSISISEIANGLDLDPQRVLKIAWSLPGLYVLGPATVLGPEEARRVGEACATAIPEQPSTPTPASGPSTRPKPAPPTSDYALQQKLLRDHHRETAQDAELKNVRSALGLSHRAVPRQRRRPDNHRKPPPRPAYEVVAAEIRTRWPYLHDQARYLAQEWVKHVVVEHFLEPLDVFAWWDAGFSPQDPAAVVALQREGIRGHMLTVQVRDGLTVKQLLNRNEPPHYLARLLKDAGLIPA